jgi:pimeloyl-ACP methyl ester carboxylesterase
MFDGFSTERLNLDEGIQIHLRVGGAGPPLLLLHGYPQTHVIWHKIAPSLTERYTVVAAGIDLTHDRLDLKRKLDCPLHILWGRLGIVGAAFRCFKPMAGAVTHHVSGRPLNCGHYLAEEAPKETLSEIFEFLTI